MSWTVQNARCCYSDSLIIVGGPLYTLNLLTGHSRFWRRPTAVLFGWKEGGRKEEGEREKQGGKQTYRELPHSSHQPFPFPFPSSSSSSCLYVCAVPSVSPYPEKHKSNSHHAFDTHTHERQIERDCCQECGNLEIKIVLGLWKWEEAHNDDESRQREKILHNLGFANRQRAPQKPQQ